MLLLLCKKNQKRPQSHEGAENTQRKAKERRLCVTFATLRICVNIFCQTCIIMKIQNAVGMTW